MVQVVTDMRKEKLLAYQPTKEEQERGLKNMELLNRMILHRSIYIPNMQRGLLLYDGVHIPDTQKRRKLKNDNFVAPFARIFVDAKTAEQVKAMSGYSFNPVEQNDAWKVDLLRDVDVHVKKVVKQKSKRIEMLKTMNIVGLSIARVGYRKTVGMVPHCTEYSDEGDMKKYEEREETIYDDIFLDIVSPFDFLIDPNATSLDDALYCGHHYTIHKDELKERFSNKHEFKNIDKVDSDVRGVYSPSGFIEGNIGNMMPADDYVLIFELHNKMTKMRTYYANGVEICYQPLAEGHFELPYFSYHNQDQFCTGFLEAFDQNVEYSPQANVTTRKSFWTVGDPVIIADLIDLRTAHGRAAHRLIKRMSQRIITTTNDFKLKSEAWEDGTVVEGGANKIQVLDLSGGGASVGQWQWAFDDLFHIMRLAIGIDPSNLADGKQKTATETEIQRETALRRLDMGLEWNEENGEVRLGKLIYKLILSRYTVPRIAKLRGDETEEELQKYDEVEDVTNEDGTITKYGKNYRRVKSSVPMSEVEKKGKYMVSEDEDGISSFLVRKEYIKSSDIDISVDSSRKASQLRSIEFDKYMRLYKLVIDSLPLTQKNPMTGESIVSIDDLPNLKEVVRGIVKAMDMNPDNAIGQGVKNEKSKEEEIATEYISQAIALNSQPSIIPSQPTQ